jgi:hypothetical protein
MNSKSSVTRFQVLACKDCQKYHKNAGKAPQMDINVHPTGPSNKNVKIVMSAIGDIQKISRNTIQKQNLHAWNMKDANK